MSLFENCNVHGAEGECKECNEGHTLNSDGTACEEDETPVSPNPSPEDPNNP